MMHGVGNIKIICVEVWISLNPGKSLLVFNSENHVFRLDSKILKIIVNRIIIRVCNLPTLFCTDWSNRHLTLDV
jgi:hypothetical protein